MIGEAVSRLDKLHPATGTRVTNKKGIIGFRNILVHGYEAVLDATVWRTATEDLPLLIQEVQDLIAVN